MSDQKAFDLRVRQTLKEYIDNLKDDRPGRKPKENRSIEEGRKSNISREKTKQLIIRTTNICRWSNTIPTIKTLYGYLTKKAPDTDVLLISYMLNIDFTLLQTTYRYIEELRFEMLKADRFDTQFDDKILIAMDAAELWDHFKKDQTVAPFVTELFSKVDTLKDFIRNLVVGMSSDVYIDLPLLSLVGHAFGLKIDLPTNTDQPKNKTKSGEQLDWVVISCINPPDDGNGSGNQQNNFLPVSISMKKKKTPNPNTASVPLFKGKLRKDIIHQQRVVGVRCCRSGGGGSGGSGGGDKEKKVPTSSSPSVAAAATYH